MDKELFKKSLFDYINCYVVAAIDLNNKMEIYEKTGNETAARLTMAQMMGLNSCFENEVIELIDNLNNSALVGENFSTDEEEVIIEEDI